MEVKLLRDFRGKETGEVFYPAGSIAAVKDHHAKRLIELGFAEEWKGEPVVIPEPPAPVVEEAHPVQPFEVEEAPAEPEPPAKKKKVKK